MKNSFFKNSLQVCNIVVLRGKTKVIKNLSFDLQSGDILVVKGPNGSGKTTLLKSIAGFLPLNSGKIILKTPIIENSPKNNTNDFLWVGEKNCLSLELSGAQNLSTLLSLMNIKFELQKHLNNDEFNILAFIDKKTKSLSSGEKQRIKLTKLKILLNSKQKIWLLDEPINGLDEKNNLSFCNILEKHKSTGGITIMSTHIPLAKKIKIKELNLEI